MLKEREREDFQNILGSLVPQSLISCLPLVIIQLNI